MDEDSFNIALRKFLKVVGVTSQREIERVVREGKIEALKAENTPLNQSSKRRSTFVDRSGLPAACI